jgi:hypothetical protein
MWSSRYTALVDQMKMAKHNTNYSGHVVTLRWRYGLGESAWSSLASFFGHSLFGHVTKLHIEGSRPGDLACYVEVHVLEDADPELMGSELTRLLDGAISRYDSTRVEISRLVPSKVEQACDDQDKLDYELTSL